MQNLIKHKIRINFKDFWNSDLIKNPIYLFLSKYFDIEISNDPDYLIYSSFGNKFKDYKCTRIFYTGENIRPNFYECDYAFSFDYPVNKRNYRLPLYKLYFDDYERIKNKKCPRKILESKTKFCNFIYSNDKAKERIIFLNQLSAYKKVDSGGKILNNIGHYVDNKVKWQSQYKFSIVFENSSYPGYTTEKILHAMAANTIPIYWGNPLVNKDFNTKSFINCHEYNSFADVIKRIIEIDNNDELFLKYMTEPYLVGNEDNEFTREKNILDKFEYIFLDNDLKPVATNPICKLCAINRRILNRFK